MIFYGEQISPEGKSHERRSKGVSPVGPVEGGTGGATGRGHLAASQVDASVSRQGGKAQLAFALPASAGGTTTPHHGLVRRIDAVGRDSRAVKGRVSGSLGVCCPRHRPGAARPHQE